MCVANYRPGSGPCRGGKEGRGSRHGAIFLGPASSAQLRRPESQAKVGDRDEKKVKGCPVGWA